MARAAHVGFRMEGGVSPAEKAHCKCRETIQFGNADTAEKTLVTHRNSPQLDNRPYVE